MASMVRQTLNASEPVISCAYGLECVAPASSLQVVQDVIMWSISIAQCLDYMMFLVISAFVFYLRGNQLDNMSFGHLC